MKEADFTPKPVPPEKAKILFEKMKQAVKKTGSDEPRENETDSILDIVKNTDTRKKGFGGWTKAREDKED